MNDRQDIEKVQLALDTTFSHLKDDPWLAQRVLANAKGEVKVKKKLSVGLILAIVLVLAAMTALAAVLTDYFGGFAKLEDTYGEYEQWPASAKVELVQLMIESDVIAKETVSQWQDIGSEQEKERAAESILADYFSDMTYVDTYNAMAKELGPIEQWTDEERALYTSLLEKYGKLTNSWPVYMIPEQDDLTREQAVTRAKDAVLSMFSISEAALDAMGTDAIFSVDEYNAYGAPKDEPFWIVEFGYGLAYRVYMTRTGEMLGIMGPQTQLIAWGRNVTDGSTEAIPGEHDATRDQAVLQARNALTEIMNVPYTDVDAMDATAYFFYSDLYAKGDEPVWLVVWSNQGQNLWQVLLGYDGSHIDVEPAGKVFDQVLRTEVPLADLCAQRSQLLGMGDSNFNSAGAYYYHWSLEEKAAYYDTWAAFVNEYESTHPYFNGRGIDEWERTRNISGLPDAQAISQAQAVSIAQKAIQDRLGVQVNPNDFAVFYYITNPDHPQWRLATAIYGVAIEAHTGEILMIKDGRSSGDRAYTISDFLAEVI